MGSLAVITASPRWRRSRWTTCPYGESIVRPFSASLTNAWDSRSRGPSSMLFRTGVGSGSAQVVVLQVAVAVLVDQPAAFGPGRLGDQDAGERQAGRVVLDELHVLQRGAGAVCQGHAVAGLDVRVRREREDPTASSGGEDDRFGGDGLDPAGRQLERHHSTDPAVVDQQRGDEPLVVADDPVVLQGGLEQRMEQVEAGLVGGEPGPHLLHAAERTDGDVPVRLAAPRAAPVLEPEQLLRRLLDERLDGVLVAQPVPAGDGVVSMLLEGVTGPDDCGGPSLGRDVWLRIG